MAKKTTREASRTSEELVSLALAGAELANRVVHYFGEETLDPLLDGDSKLRDDARALLARWWEATGR